MIKKFVELNKGKKDRNTVGKKIIKCPSQMSPPPRPFPPPKRNRCIKKGPDDGK